MKIIPLTLVMAAMTFVGARAADEQTPMMLERGSWVCDTQESYGQALAEQKSAGKSLRDLRKNLESHCIYMDEDNLKDMMAPWVTVLEQQADYDKVSFAIQSEQRISVINQKIKQMKYTGWTAVTNIKPRW